MTSLAKKERKRTVHSFLGLKKFFFAIYIYIYLYIYISVYLYISINIYWKTNEGWACILFKRTQHSAFFCVCLQKNVAFFYVPCKRMLHSLRSFTFFAKECRILCVLLGFISRQKLKKERKRTLRFWRVQCNWFII